MPNENKPWLFDPIPGLHSTTLIHSSKRSNSDAPHEYSFTVEELANFINSNYDDFIADTADTASIHLTVLNGELTADILAVGTGSVIDTNDLLGGGAVPVPLQSLIDVFGVGSSSAPSDEIIFGTGSGITSSPDLLHSNSSGVVIAKDGTAANTIMQANMKQANAPDLGGFWAFSTNTAVVPDFFGKIGFNFEGGANNTSRQFQVYVSDGGTPKFVVNGIGRIGIGVTAPAEKLDVSGSIKYTEAIKPGGDAGTTGFLLTSASGGVNTWTDPTTIGNSKWSTNTNGINYNSGNVGIGISLPTEKLDIIGNIKQYSTGTTTHWIGDGSKNWLFSHATGDGDLKLSTSADKAFRFQDSGGNDAVVIDLNNGDLQYYSSQLHNGTEFKNIIKKTTTGAGIQIGSTITADWNRINCMHPVLIGNGSLDGSAVLEIISTTQGVRFPNMTEAQRDNISSPAKGLTVFVTDAINKLFTYDGSSWQPGW